MPIHILMIISAGKHGLSVTEIESLFDRPVVILPDKENA
jgi:hypothetical protein